MHEPPYKILKCLYVQIKYWCYATSVISHIHNISTVTNATVYSSCFPSSSHCSTFHKFCFFWNTGKHCRTVKCYIKKEKKVKSIWFKHQYECTGLVEIEMFGYLLVIPNLNELRHQKPAQKIILSKFLFWSLRWFLKFPKTRKSIHYHAGMEPKWLVPFKLASSWIQAQKLFSQFIKSYTLCTSLQSVRI